MSATFADWSRNLPSNPQKPPHWRWALMQTLRRDVTRPVQRWPDQWAQPLFDFQSLQDAIGPDWSTAARLPDLSPLAGAYRLWAAPELVWDRELLQARLLTGESSAAVAARFGLPTGLIDTYITVFYDVPCRLQHPMYIRHQVIGPGLHRPELESDLKIALRNLAFMCGPYVLDALLGTIADQIQTQELDDPALHRAPDQELQALIRHYVATFRRPSDAKSLQEYAWTQQLGRPIQQPQVGIQTSIIYQVDPLAALLADREGQQPEIAISSVYEISTPSEPKSDPDPREEEAA